MNTGSLYERMRGYHPSGQRGCHRLLRHRVIKALVVKTREAQRRGDVFGAYMLRLRLDRELGR